MRPSQVAFLAGRLLFGGYFAYAGIRHLVAGEGMVAAAAANGVPAPELAVAGTGVLLLAGGLSIAAAIFPRVGLLLILLFLAGVTPAMHAFWTFEDPQARAIQLAAFLRNVAYAGASLALYGVPVPWIWGIGGPAAFPRPRPARPPVG